MIPIPPATAIAIAISDSVTVSILALTIGIFNFILREKLVLRLINLREVILENFGTNKTSSKLNPSLIFFSLFTISILPEWKKITICYIIDWKIRAYSLVAEHLIC